MTHHLRTGPAWTVQVYADTITLKSKVRVQSFVVLIFGIASILIFFIFYICWPSQEQGSADNSKTVNHRNCMMVPEISTPKLVESGISGYNHDIISPSDIHVRRILTRKLKNIFIMKMFQRKMNQF